MKLFESNRLYVDINRWKYYCNFRYGPWDTLPEICHLIKNGILNLQTKV